MVRVLLIALALFALSPAARSADTRPISPQVSESNQLSLEIIVRVRTADGREKLIPGKDIRFEKQAAVSEDAFLAVRTNQWPAGLIPIFASKGTNQFELSRRPAAGDENFATPLFFAVPPPDEPQAEQINGFWDCRAVRGDGSKTTLAFELGSIGDAVFGRFDPFSDYRVVDIAGGTFRSNRLELNVKYVQDSYVLRGEWRDGKLSGTWSQITDEEQGTWEASREALPLPRSSPLTGLYEIRRISDHTRRYVLEDSPLETGWHRQPRPLCLVWLKRKN